MHQGSSRFCFMFVLTTVLLLLLYWVVGCFGRQQTGICWVSEFQAQGFLFCWDTYTYQDTYSIIWASCPLDLYSLVKYCTDRTEVLYFVLIFDGIALHFFVITCPTINMSSVDRFLQVNKMLPSWGKKTKQTKGEGELVMFCEIHQANELSSWTNAGKLKT